MTKVLIVDDEPGVLESTGNLLTELGYEVVTTTNHAEVLDLIHEDEPDVILQDIRMPGLDIDSYIRTIRGNPAVVRGTPIILFSAALELPQVEERVHAAAVIEKPFKAPDLVAAIDQALEKAGKAQKTRGEQAQTSRGGG